MINSKIVILIIIAIFYQMRLSAQDVTLSMPLDSIWGPQFVYSHSANDGTAIIEPDGKTIRYFHRKAEELPIEELIPIPKAAFETLIYQGQIPYRNGLFEDISYDGGLTWYFNNPVINTGDNSIWELANVHPYTGEIYLMYERGGKGRLIRTLNKRTDWSKEITLPFSFTYTSGSFIWLKDIESSGFHRMITATSGYTYYSDDDGRTWVGPSNFISSHKSNGDNITKPDGSPYMVELKDGRIQMFTRNSKLHHWEFLSINRGASWEEGQPSRFYGFFSNTQYRRIHDGRIVHLWLNNVPWSDVLSPHNTARDIVHAAISDDDGKSFRGYREVAMDKLRHDSIYSTVPAFDVGQHHQKFVVTSDNKMILWTGQDHWNIWRNSSHRQVVMFDLGWLYETKRKIDFSNGYKNLHVWKLSDDRVGDTNYRSRKLGATIIDHPTVNDSKVLEIRSKKNEIVSFYNEEGQNFSYGVLTHQDGAVWNFPTGPEGTVTTRILLQSGFKGAVISLTNGFWNPADPNGDDMAMYSLHIPANGKINGVTHLETGKWYTITLKWTKANNGCQVYVDNILQDEKLTLKNRPSVDGINYILYRSTSESEDKGFLVDFIEADVSASYNN